MVALHNAGTYRLTGIDKPHLLFIAVLHVEVLAVPKNMKLLGEPKRTPNQALEG
jgi:hypothetical protein